MTRQRMWTASTEVQMAFSPQVGTTYEVTRLLTGDISVGYDQRFYADPPPLRPWPVPCADGQCQSHLRCDATDDIDLDGSDRTLAKTTLANSSAVVAHTLSLKISHDLLRNLTLAATGTYQINNYIGQPEIDQFYSGLFEADYHMTRSIMITGSYKYQRYTSTARLHQLHRPRFFSPALKFQL